MSRFSIALILMSVLATNGAARAATQTLYIGGYSKDPNGGVCAAQFDPDTGQLSAARVVAVTPNPSWIALAPNGKTLYAANESGAVDGQNTGGVSSFSVEPSGDLKALNQRAVAGGLAHLSLDATGQWLAGASYNGGTVSLWPTAKNGALGERAQFFQHVGSGPNLNRQKSPHPHQVVFSPDNRRLWAVDLGIDKALSYNFDADRGALSLTAAAFVAPGSGPRHMDFKTNGDLAYVVGELSNTISVFELAGGVPNLVQTISTLPADAVGQNYAAEIAVSPNGRFVYASNRGDSSGLAVFQISREGRLSLSSQIATDKSPRHFSFAPSGRWLLVANQQTRSIQVFAIDKSSGALSLAGRLDNVPNEPTCLVFGSAA